MNKRMKRFYGVDGNDLELKFWHSGVGFGTDADVVMLIDKTGNSFHERMNLLTDFKQLIEGDLILKRRGSLRAFNNRSKKTMTITGHDLGRSLSVTFNKSQLNTIRKWIESTATEIRKQSAAVLR